MAKRTPTSAPAARKRAASKKPNGSAGVFTADVPQPSADDIRLRAYHRYLERGGTPGRDFDDWVEAEKELKATRS
jgi:hypothetical protein